MDKTNNKVDTSFFGKLRKIFSNGIIMMRDTNDTNRLKIIDTSHLQSNGNENNTRFIDRYTRIYSGAAGYGNNYSQNRYNYFSSKQELYSDYEVMDTDSIIASALDIYTDECIVENTEGDILTINCEDDSIKKILNNLFYDILNIEFNLWPWIRNLCKYGDMFLHLEIQQGVGIIGITPLSAYEVERLENADPKNPNSVQFKLIDDQRHIFEDYEMAHFRLLSDSNFLPYGKSIIEPARKTWKQLCLLEDAMLINRIMRAPERRIFNIDVGNIPTNEVDTYMQKVINKIKKTPFIDPTTGDYNLKFNMQNMIEDYFLPTRGDKQSTRIDTLPGMEFTGIDDVKYLQNRLLSALKIPRAFLTYEEDLNGKATLAAEDVRFAKTIQRIQRIVVSELYKIAYIHLYSQGYNNKQLLSFELSMTSPSIIYEQQKIELLKNKLDLTQNILNTKIFSREWIYKNIFQLSDNEIDTINDSLLKYSKADWRIEKISQDGDDPITESTPDTNSDENEYNEMEHTPPDDNINNDHSSEELPDESSSNEEPSTPPETPLQDNVNIKTKTSIDKPDTKTNNYTTARKIFGDDILGSNEYKNSYKENINIIKKYGLQNIIKQNKILQEDLKKDSEK